MKRTAMLAAVVVVSSGCAVFNNLRAGNVSGAVDASRDVAHETAGAALQAQARATDEDKRRCEPLKTTPVGWIEERSVGGAVMLGSLENAGYFIDKDDEHDAKKLQTRVNHREKIVLAPSDRNDLTTYVEHVGGNLAALSSRPGIPWAFGVVDSPTPNAFSAPGGYVVVSTGLLKLMTNEAQLAGVLAHEIAHVTQRHSLKAYMEQRAFLCNKVVYIKAYKDLGVSQLPSGFADFSAVADDAISVLDSGGFNLDAAKGGVVVKLVDLTLQLLSKGKSKEDEFEADVVGIELVAAAGYDTAEYSAFLKKLPSSGGIMSNHPSASDRVAKLSAWKASNPFAVGDAKPALEATKVLK